MYGIIYKTTCLVNGKIYIGQTTQPEDKTYLGSGTKLHNAIKRCGRSNFVRQTVAIAKDQDSLDYLEGCIIRAFDSTNSVIGYNILPGTANKFGASNPASIPSVRRKMSRKAKARGSNRTGAKHSERSKAMMKATRLNRYKELPDQWKANISAGMKANKTNVGIKRTDEQKRKISETRKRKIAAGEITTPMQGKIWITDGVIQKQWNPSDAIPEGFRRGCKPRLIKQ